MVVGIDLGTTFSVISYVDKDGKAQIIPNRDGARTTPSVVMFEDDQVVVGQQATNKSLLDPLSTVQFIKRQMGSDYRFISEKGDKYSPEQISAIILKRLKEDAEEYLGQTIHQAVITVPAYFNDTERKSTQDAGKIAGLNVLAVINEPTAAAFAYGMDNKDTKATVLVYDLGGGTFDATIMKIDFGKINVCATDGNKNLGGRDFDNSIITYVKEAFIQATGLDLSDDDGAMQDLRVKAEEAKKALSTRQKTTIVLFSQGKPFKIEITRDKFEDLICNTVDSTETILENVLEDSKLSWSDIDKVLLVGGSTRVPLVREMVKKISNIEPSLELNPDEVVAMGAAYFAVTKNTENNPAMQKDSEQGIPIIEINDVNSHSLGIIAYDSQDRNFNSIILPKNTTIPAKGTSEYVTSMDSQRQILLQVTQGEDEDIKYVKIIGESVLKLKDRPKGSPISVEVSYDENAIIHVSVIDLVDNSNLGEMEIKRKSNLNDNEIENSKSALSKLIID